MIKMVSELNDGRTLVVLGLSKQNVARLQQDRPIVFDLASIGLPPQPVAIAWKHDDGMTGFPGNFRGVGLVFSSKALQAARKVPIDIEYGKLLFCVLVGDTEATMEAMVRPLISWRTKVTHSGFAPSDLPPSNN